MNDEEKSKYDYARKIKNSYWVKQKKELDESWGGYGYFNDDEFIKILKNYEDYEKDLKYQKKKEAEQKRKQKELAERGKEQFRQTSAEVAEFVCFLFQNFNIKSFNLICNFNESNNPVEIKDLLIEKDGYEFLFDAEYKLIKNNRVMLGLVQRLTKSNLDDILYIQDTQNNNWGFENICIKLKEMIKINNQNLDIIKYYNGTKINFCENVNINLTNDSYETQLNNIFDNEGVALGISKFLEKSFIPKDKVKKISI